MLSDFLIALTHNAALLLAVGLLYDVFSRENKKGANLAVKLLFGVVIGLIAVVLMSTPAKLAPGIIFDTRTILICITGLYFSSRTTIIAIIIASTYRFHLGGAGVTAGIATIMTAGGVGILWNRYRRTPGKILSLGEHYCFGLIVHVVMLLCMFLLPAQLIMKTILSLLIPVLVIYPFGTALLGYLLSSRQKRVQSEGELLASEELHRTILETALDGIIRADSTGKILETNDAYCQMSGYSHADLATLTFSDIEGLRDTEQIKKIISKIKEDGYGFFETRHRRKDGSLFDLEVSSQYLPIDGGQIVSFLRDVTKRKKIEQEYRKLLEGIRNIVLRINLSGKITYINNYGLNLFGYKREELVGHHVLETIVPAKESSGRELATFIKKVINQPEDYETVENENICKDGRRVYIQWRNRAEYDESGRPIGVLSVGADITERQKAKEVLTYEKEKFRTLFEHVTDYALVLRPLEDELVICDLSESACRVYGYTREELLGKPITFIDVDKVPHDDWRLQKIRAGETVRFEATHRRKDGSTFIVEAVVRMISVDGEPLVFSIERDLSKRKQAEAEKAELEKSLRQKFKMEAVGTLAGGIAHDFNNIIAIILGSAEMLKRRLGDDDNSKAKIDRILTAGRRAKSLVEQVLAFSRQQEQTLHPIAIIPLVEETIDLLRASLPRTVELRTCYWEGVETFSINADPGQIQQVLINLCSNAVFAMQEKGAIYISLSRASDSLAEMFAQKNSAGFMQLTVRDTGEGISSDEIEKIFDPFYTTKDVGQGTGLGLSVVHGIVQNHNGMIHVESQPGEGSTFQILLPLTTAETQEESAEEEPLLTGTERILIVDDEEDLSLWVEEMLLQQGFKPVRFSNSQMALEHLRTNQDAFDLMITDQSMPGMSGVELIEQIRRILPNLPVILCSGYSSRISEETLQKLNISGYLQKPYQSVHLIKKIRSCLDKKLTS